MPDGYTLRFFIMVSPFRLKGLMGSDMITALMDMCCVKKPSITVTVLLACLFLAGTVSAGGIQAYVGDVVPLSGYSVSSNNVYLFLTGPNLPVNGVALNDITKLSEEGGFKVVPVMGGDDSWSYKWGTSNINGRLDDGTYTVWVADCPCDRAHLQNANYGTISVTLGSPGISAGIQSPQSDTISKPQPGSLVVSSTPDTSSVTVNGQYKGSTPLTLENLDTGTYTVNVSKFGYAPYSVTNTLGPGETLAITATLPADRGSLAVNTTPAGANVSVDGTFMGISPVVIPNILPGNHTIGITKEGYIPETREADIIVGTEYPMSVTLSAVFPFSIPGKTPLPVGLSLAALCSAIALIGYCRSKNR